MYAYDDVDLSLRQEMEYRHMGLEVDIQNQKNEYHRLDGRAEMVVKLVERYPELKEEAEALLKEAEHKLAQVNNTMGREQAIRELMHIHDEFKNKEIKLKDSESYV